MTGRMTSDALHLAPLMEREILPSLENVTTALGNLKAKSQTMLSDMNALCPKQ